MKLSKSLTFPDGTAQQTAAMAFNVYAAGAYPTRPNATVVIWIGPADPGSSANTNDLWVNTT